MLRVGYKSDKGRNRELNEDACAVVAEERLFIVADGVGGNNAGEIASRTAVETCRDFMSLDTTLPATQSIMINLYRNPTVYGDIHFKLWNPEKEIAESQARLSIAGMETTSDENGNVALFVPLEKQRKSYHIESSLALYSDTIYMPCGENDVVLTR
jgi:serine/threonine protein phosphatase PrpC